MRIALLHAGLSSPHHHAITEALARADVDVVAHDLADERMAPCRGCFECWVAHPGTCHTRDAGNAVMRDIIGADAVLWAVTPRFGCWNALAKAALDRTIGLLSPFFRVAHGETYHRARYRRYPRLCVLAVVPEDTPDPERERFRRIAARNATNMHSEPPWVGFVHRDGSAEAVAAAVGDALQEIREPTLTETPIEVPLPPREGAVGVAPRKGRPRHVVLLVGSAKPPGTSTSEALGAHLLGLLAAWGWSTETLPVQRCVKLGREGAPTLVAAAGRADLVVLASPVYVDCLPALVLAGLDALSRSEIVAAPALLPIIQCGFPELSHTRLALEVVAAAADTAGWPWAGHLACGAGGLIHGAPLADLGGKVHAQVQALEATAAALDAGAPVPPEATETFGRSPVSPRIYRTLGQIGWLSSALQHRALTALADRPFDEA